MARPDQAAGRPIRRDGSALSTDLAARHLGAGVIAASDDSFGPKELLLAPGPVAFVPGRYDHRGEVVDGWETRRRGPGEDWVVIRLGVPGIVETIDVDTTSFTGNAPSSCRLQAAAADGHPSLDQLSCWQQVLPDTPLQPDAHNVLVVDSPQRWTHLRLWIVPDGGVGRLRVRGRAVPDPQLLRDLTVDLAAEELGAEVVGVSDDFYSPAEALLRPDRPRTMGEGWETRRRRGPGHDVVVVRLGLAGLPRLVEVDTTHFVHNASSAGALWTLCSPEVPASNDPRWQPLLPLTPLQPDTRHRFRVEGQLATHVRLDAHPDGGLARLRIIGPVSAEARAQAAITWLDALPTNHGREFGVSEETLAGRPYRHPAALTTADPVLARWLL